MIIVVDAYNVLKQIKQDIISHFERMAFIKKLKQYARAKRHSIVVVFDGGQCVWPMIEKNKLVTIVYSGEQLSADDYIRRYMKEHKNKELLLVTNDQELRNNARRHEIEFIDSLAFYARLVPHEKKQKKRDDSQLIRLSADAPAEVDALMSEIGRVPEKREEGDGPSRKSSGFTPSKKERRMNKKIKKL